MFITTYKEQYKQNLKLATPIVLSQLGLIVVQLADNMMVGPLGTIPLAAVSFGSTVFFMMFIFCVGISLALTPLVGEMYAQGRYRTAGIYLQNSILLYSILGVLAFGLMYVIRPLLYHLGTDAQVVDMAMPYYEYLVWSIIPLIIFNSFKQFLEGLGNTSANMVILIITNCVNVFFNFALIYGMWGFPEMGVAGAGLATLISRICTPIMALAYFMITPRYKRYFKYFSWSNFEWKWMRTLLAVGLPIAAQMLMEGAAFAATTFMMGWISPAAQAANQIATQISSIAFMIVVGIGNATTIRISHAYGRGDWSNLKKSANASYHITLVWNTISAVSIILLRDHIPLLFKAEPEVHAIASNLLIFVAAFQYFDGIQAMTIGVLRGMQDVTSIMRIALVSYIIINIPVAYFFAFVLNWGPGGLWAGFMFGLSMAAILLYLRYSKILRQQLQRAG